jgi:hypothetical protein
MTTTQRLRQALQALYDEQTGPPCKRHELEWRLAMREAERVLDMERENTVVKRK